MNYGWSPAAAQPPLRRGRWVLLAIVAVVLVVGAGVGTYAGVRQAGGSATTGPFGDPATLDLCALVNRDAFAEENTDVQIQPKGLGECEVFMELRDVVGGYTVTLTAEDRVKDDPDAAVSSWGVVSVAKDKATAGHGECTRSVYDSGRAGVVITATLTGDTVDTGGNPKPGYDPCAPADQATAAVVAAVQADKVNHLRYPADSLGSIDLCATTSVAQVDAALNVTDISLAAKGTRQMCIYRSPSASGYPGVLLSSQLETDAKWQRDTTDVGPDSSGVDVSTYDATSTTSTIAGRNTLLMAHTSGTADNIASTTCIAETAQKQWKQWPGAEVIGGGIQASRNDAEVSPADDTGLVETAMIWISLPQGTSRLTCQAAAQQLATQIWPRLPTPSAH